MIRQTKELERNLKALKQQTPGRRRVPRASRANERGARRSWSKLKNQEKLCRKQACRAADTACEAREKTVQVSRTATVGINAM